MVLVVVQRWTASSTSYIFVLMPVVAVALGALVADERITATTILGGGIVCAGVYMGALLPDGCSSRRTVEQASRSLRRSVRRCARQIPDR